MKASIYVMKDDNVLVTTPDSPVKGLRLPYLTKSAHPVFALDSEQAVVLDSVAGTLDALPGMVGISHVGSKLYVVDAEGQAQIAPFHVVTAREYERFRYLSQSFRHESA